jgi:hypothetical protein
MPADGAGRDAEMLGDRCDPHRGGVAAQDFELARDKRLNRNHWRDRASVVDNE